MEDIIDLKWDLYSLIEKFIKDVEIDNVMSANGVFRVKTEQYLDCLRGIKNLCLPAIYPNGKNKKDIALKVIKQTAIAKVLNLSNDSKVGNYEYHKKLMRDLVDLTKEGKEKILRDICEEKGFKPKNLINYLEYGWYKKNATLDSLLKATKEDFYVLNYYKYSILQKEVDEHTALYLAHDLMNKVFMMYNKNCVEYPSIGISNRLEIKKEYEEFTMKYSETVKSLKK